MNEILGRFANEETSTVTGQGIPRKKTQPATGSEAPGVQVLHQLWYISGGRGVGG
jgi:hypothetical protein